MAVVNRMRHFLGVWNGYQIRQICLERQSVKLVPIPAGRRVAIRRTLSVGFFQLLVRSPIALTTLPVSFANPSETRDSKNVAIGSANDTMINV
jgi:hypothetical protein